ncbi:MAG: menaquinone biosynthesis protein [Desulfobulbaceae bacterium]|nr:menaquinone biosynthesis protein [Desulfobulbaceae bacterium]
MRVKARIGMVNFINTAPFYEIWRRTVVRPDWQVTEATPAVLNRLLYAGELDLGFFSSHEYAVHPGSYKILGDLSISASGPVGSVLLLSSVAPEELDGQLVFLSSQSQTSVSLVKIVLEEFYGVRPRYQVGTVADLAQGRERPAAVLVIGDEALRMRKLEEYPFRIDLGETWHHHTGLPFVFAVWAVREDFCASDPDTVVEIHQELLRCIDQGKQELQDISALVATRIPMPVEECFEYLRGLEYDLGPQKQEALRCFYEYLIKRGEGVLESLPLKICG